VETNRQVEASDGRASILKSVHPPGDDISNVSSRSAETSTRKMRALKALKIFQQSSEWRATST
jgi:hypothetical protein